MSNKDQLYSKLASIGFRVNVEGPIDKPADIETTLVESLYQVDSDSRLLSLIFSWFTVHHKHIVADKLFRTYEKYREVMGECPWFNGACAYLCYLKDYRFKKGNLELEFAHSIGNRDQSVAIKRKGAIEYLKDINILVANGNIRIREEDVLSVEELVKKNSQYRNRLIFGANWRAEIITAIKNGAKNANQVAESLGIQNGRVGVVLKEYRLISSHLNI